MGFLHLVMEPQKEEGILETCFPAEKIFLTRRAFSVLKAWGIPLLSFNGPFFDSPCHNPLPISTDSNKDALSNHKSKKGTTLIYEFCYAIWKLKRKKKKKNEQGLRKMLDTIKLSNMRILGIPENKRERRSSSINNVWEVPNMI